MTRSLQRLLAPESLAVIGGKEAARVVEQCIKFGFEGPIWPVHPSREEMHGYKCFRSIADLPCAPDAAYVAVNRERTRSMSSRNCERPHAAVRSAMRRVLPKRKQKTLVPPICRHGCSKRRGTCRSSGRTVMAF